MDDYTFLILEYSEKKHFSWMSKAAFIYSHRKHYNISAFPSQQLQKSLKATQTESITNPLVLTDSKQSKWRIWILHSVRVVWTDKGIVQPCVCVLQCNGKDTVLLSVAGAQAHEKS